MATEPSKFPILIVDDDEPTQNLLRAVLRRCGYASDVAANSGEAIGLLRENEYAAVLLDMMMPEVSGHEVIAFLGMGVKRVPVIVCSAVDRWHWPALMRAWSSRSSASHSILSTSWLL